MFSPLATRAAVLLVATSIAGAASAFDPSSPEPVNLDPNGVTLKGYDPVAYYTEGAPTPGDASIVAEYNGAIYHFASTDNRDAFAANPGEYAPAYGGFCAMAMSLGYKVDIDPTAWKIVGDQLYVQASPRAAEVWQKDIPGNIAKANDFWPKVKDTAPADLR